MPSYRTLAQILIATSAVGSALAAPAPAQEMRDARADLSQLDRRIHPDLKAIGYTAPLAGVISGLILTSVWFINKATTGAITQGWVAIPSEFSPANANTI
jgi:hypothetical protein